MGEEIGMVASSPVISLGLAVMSIFLLRSCVNELQGMQDSVHCSSLARGK